MTRVLLIRHAETAWNRERRWQGHADIPLTPDGEMQALRLAERLRRDYAAFSALYTSDLRRAAHTARIVGETIGLAPVPDAAWREMDVGLWSGLARDEIELRFADDWRRILAGEDLPRGGGETFAGFTARVAGALAAVRERHPAGTAAVVTHGGVIRAVVLHLLGLPFSRLREIAAVDNTAGAELSCDDGRWHVAGALPAAPP